MVVYTGNVIKIPKEQQESKALVHRQSSTAIATPKRTLFDELDEFMNHGDTSRPRIESKPEPEPFVVNRPSGTAPKATPETVHKPTHKTQPKTPQLISDPELDERLSKFHHICWDDDEVTLSNLRMGSSGGKKSITITLSTSNSYRFGRLLEQVEEAMPKKTPAARRPTSRKPPARR